jgi:EmrB/QacA subfamily drug resistance transporter
MEIAAPSALSDNTPALGWVLVAVALTTMLAPLNSTMIGVALPRITGEFNASLAESSWLIIAYLIAMASLQPVTGKLGDRFGYRRLLLGGLVYFALASLGAATATSLQGLLFFRVQQAIAGAIALPNGMALMRLVVPVEQRGSRFGLVGSAVVLAAAAGPPLGGLLTEWIGWRAIFYVNLLLIAPALFIGFRVLPVTNIRKNEHPFDLVGAVLLLCVLTGGAFLLTWKGERDLLWAGGICALVSVCYFFLKREWHHPDPALEPRLFRHRTFAAVNSAIALSNLAMYTTFLTIPLFLSERAGWDTATIGLVLATLWAPTVVCAPLGGYLADHWGRRWPVNIGLALLTLGLFTLTWIGPQVALPVLIGGLVVAGIGLGLSQAGMQTAAVETVSQREAGVAAGLFSTSRYIGSIVGSSVLPTLYLTGGLPTVR